MKGLFVLKKFLCLFMAVLATLLCFVSCDEGDVKENTTSEVSVSEDVTSDDVTSKDDTVIKIAGLKGPTSIGLVKLLEDNDQGKSENKYEFTMAGAADEIVPKLTKGELDMAAIPSNLAAVLNSKTEGGIKVLAINTLGVTYIVEKNAGITDIADLKGKTIYATGKGSTPEYSLRHILSANGIDPDKDVTFEWKTEPTEVVALLKSKGGVAMLPQPYVTVASASVEGLKTVINLNDEWNKLDNGSKLITGVLVARTEFCENHPDLVAAFLSEYKNSIEFANSNLKEASVLVEKRGIVAKSAVAEKAIPFCNVSYIDGSEMKTALSGFYSVLFEIEPKSVGRKLPTDNFYHE